MSNKTTDKAQGNFANYTAGFIVSLALTSAAFLLVYLHVYGGHAARSWIIPLVIGLAVVQCVAQLVLFLHLGRESKPHWKFMMFGLMMLVVTILVGGSLWIMYNLNYRMTPQQTNKYLQEQDGL